MQLIFKKKYYDIKHLLQFKVDLKVYLLKKDLINNKKGNLALKKSGPFTILKKISEVSYKLKLPNSFRIFLVFHVLLHEPAYENEFKEKKNPYSKTYYT